MNPELLAVAAAQDGLFTTAQAHAAGHDKWALVGLVRSGACLHLARGLYAVPTLGEQSPDEAHRLLGRGGLLLYPDATLAGHSALVALGLPVWGANLQRAHLERPVKREVLTERFVIRPSARRQGATVGRSGDEPESQRHVAPAVAVVQHCLEHGAAAGIVSADAGLHRRVIDMHGLERAAEAVRGWPRSSRVRTMLTHVDARSESVGESRLRFALAVAGVTLQPQVLIRDEAGRAVARVDFLVEGTKVVIEFDGKVKYADGGADALMAEKRREDRLRRLGYVVVRVTWADLSRMDTVIRWIRQACALQGNVEPVRGSQGG